MTMMISPKTSADADGPERAVVFRVGDDRAAAGEHEREGREALGGGAASERQRCVHRRAHPIALTNVNSIDICR